MTEIKPPYEHSKDWIYEFKDPEGSVLLRIRFEYVMQTGTYNKKIEPTENVFFEESDIQQIREDIAEQCRRHNIDTPEVYEIQEALDMKIVSQVMSPYIN